MPVLLLISQWVFRFGEELDFTSTIVITILAGVGTFRPLWEDRLGRATVVAFGAAALLM